MAINESVITEKHPDNLDVSKVAGGYVELELKELHLDNNNNSFEDKNLHFIMADNAGNKRVLSVNLDEFDDELRELGYRIDKNN